MAAGSSPSAVLCRSGGQHGGRPAGRGRLAGAARPHALPVVGPRPGLRAPRALHDRLRVPYRGTEPEPQPSAISARGGLRGTCCPTRGPRTGPPRRHRRAPSTGPDQGRLQRRQRCSRACDSPCGPLAPPVTRLTRAGLLARARGGRRGRGRGDPVPDDVDDADPRHSHAVRSPAGPAPLGRLAGAGRHRTGRRRCRCRLDPAPDRPRHGRPGGRAHARLPQPPSPTRRAGQDGRPTGVRQKPRCVERGGPRGHRGPRPGPGPAACRAPRPCPRRPGPWVVAASHGPRGGAGGDVRPTRPRGRRREFGRGADP